MSDHNSHSTTAHQQHEDEVETGATFEIHNVLAYTSLVLGLLCVLYWFRFQAFDNSSNTSFTNKIENWWNDKNGSKGLGGVKLGTPKIKEETPAPAPKPIPATTTAITEAKNFLVATDQTMLEIPATAGQYPNGYWISGSGEYRIGYWNTSGVFKTLHSKDYENGEIIYFPSDRDWKKPIYAACRKGWTNVTVTVHPPD